jgi:predicted phage terminase large subunit-like protein
VSTAAQWSADLILIEKASSGLSLIQDLRSDSPLNIVAITPKGDKATRLMNVSAMIEGGRVSLLKDVPWLADLQHEITLFPNAGYADQVHSLSQFLGWLK